MPVLAFLVSRLLTGFAGRYSLFIRGGHQVRFAGCKQKSLCAHVGVQSPGTLDLGPLFMNGYKSSLCFWP